MIRGIAVASKLLPSLLLASLFAAGAQAQSQFPSKPVKLISDSAPGSNIDVTLRVFADRMSKAWGQQVVILNHPGAGGAISARVASEADPDGYTYYMPALSVFLAVPGKAANLPLQLPRDFIPVGFFAENPMFIAASPKLGVATLPELIAAAKQRPGEISYAVTGVGRLTHLTGELLQDTAGIKLLMVPYTGGSAQAIGDVVGGRVPLIIEGFAGALASSIQGGTLKALAQGSPKRLAEFPDLPAVAETLPGFAATGWQVLVAPKGTPEAMVSATSEMLRKVVADPELKKTLAARGAYTRPMTQQEALTFVQSQQQQWKPILDRLALQQR